VRSRRREAEWTTSTGPTNDVVCSSGATTAGASAATPAAACENTQLVQWVLDFSWQSKSWCRKADPSSTNTYNKPRARWLGLRTRVVVDRNNATVVNLKAYRLGRSKTTGQAGLKPWPTSALGCGHWVLHYPKSNASSPKPVSEPVRFAKYDAPR